MQILAGAISSMIFASATVSMVYKAWRTKDLHSYSRTQLVLNNVGNVLHWLYIASLPMGPIWLLHGFFTVTTMLMLVWAITYRNAPVVEDDPMSLESLIQTQELIAVYPGSHYQR